MKRVLLASLLAAGLWVYAQSNPTISSVVVINTREVYAIEVEAAADLAAKAAVDIASEPADSIHNTPNCVTCKVPKPWLARDSPAEEEFPSM